MKFDEKTIRKVTICTALLMAAMTCFAGKATTAAGN